MSDRAALQREESKAATADPKYMNEQLSTIPDYQAAIYRTPRVLSDFSLQLCQIPIPLYERQGDDGDERGCALPRHWEIKAL